MPKKSEATAYSAETLYREGELSVMQIAKKLGISKSTLYKYLRFRNVAISKYEHQNVDTLHPKVLIKMKLQTMFPRMSDE